MLGKQFFTIKDLIHRHKRKSSTIFSQVFKEGWYQARGSANTEAEAILGRSTYGDYDISIDFTDQAKPVSMPKMYNR